MAISLLQDAQTRSLAAALAGIKRDESMVERSLTMSPPMSANNSATTALYPGLQQAAAATAFGMLSPSQLLAANRQAAAAFMAAAQLPSMSTLASTLFPHHPALFGTWAPLSAAPHSPPASPHSPITSSTASSATMALSSLSSTPANNNNNNNNNNNHSNHNNKHMISPTGSHQGDLPAKKPRKLTVKKDLISPPIEISMSVSDLYHTPSGPISPPSSGSSPNSTHDGPTMPAAAGGLASTLSGHRDPSRDKSFTCKICHRSFGYKHVLQNHERTHTGEKPFECPECHKRFTRDHHLKTHMRLHTGEKPYHCSHCDRQFVQVANLRRHLRVHTGERPYTCEICDGKFSDSNQLKSHMLVHNGEKPFECERCHAKFRRRHHHLNHKCGIQSPPTPALSPAMSGDFPICDQKSAMGSSYGSEESMEICKPNGLSSLAASTLSTPASLVSGSSMHHLYDSMDHSEAPLDLSEDAASLDDAAVHLRLQRKAQEIRRVFRLPPPQIMHVASDLPEQTEPEDLSMHNPRSRDAKLMAGKIAEELHRASRHFQRQSLHEEQRMHESSPEPMLSMHDDVDLDELDDAATLYMRQQQQHLVLKREKEQREREMQMD